MKSNHVTRRDFSVRLAAVLSVIGVSSVWAPGGSSPVARPEGGDELSHSAEAIHQEVVINASRTRVYEALTDAKQFDKVVHFGEEGMSRGKKPTEISREVGGAFSLFGGYIVGRNLELAPGERLVQAWREVSWQPGVYSIVKFDLREQGAATKIVFDHTGFPQGAGPHLLIGWKANYWDPLRKYLAQAN
jgi:uncharacterized protein YndB with AHSA1/START domain